MSRSGSGGKHPGARIMALHAVVPRLGLRRVIGPALFVLVTAGSVACGGGEPAADAACRSVPATAIAGKVSANCGTLDELAGAFESAGVPDGTRWAVEVLEYRPYPADDPTFIKLRRELAKYGPGPGVLDAIVSTLSLP